MSFLPRVSNVLALASMCSILSPVDVAGFAPLPLSFPVRRSLMHAEARPGKFVKDFGGPVDLPSDNQSLPPHHEREELNHLLSEDFKGTNGGAKRAEWLDDITRKHDGNRLTTNANDASPHLQGRDSPRVDPLAKLMVGFSKAGLSQVTHAALLISLTLATVFAPLNPAVALDSGGRMGGAVAAGGSSSARQSITSTYSSSYSSSRSYGLSPSSSGYYNRGGYGTSSSYYGSPRYYRAAPRPPYNNYSPYYGGGGVSSQSYYYGGSPLALGPPRGYVAPPYAGPGGVVMVATSTPSVFDAFAIGAFLFFFTSL